MILPRLCRQLPHIKLEPSPQGLQKAHLNPHSQMRMPKLCRRTPSNQRMRSQQINEREENTRAQKMQMNCLQNEVSLLLAGNAQSLQIKIISQAHHSKDTNVVIVMDSTSIESVS